MKTRSLPKIAIIMISSLLSIAAAGPAGASNHHDSEKVISVNGSASASVEPDLVVVRFGVEIQKDSSAEALEANAVLMKDVINALQKAGIDKDEISTSRFNIQAVYESHQDKTSGRHRQVLAGYRVSNIVAVETGKLKLVAPIIDNAVAAGVNRVDGVQFILSPDVLAQLKDELIEQAVLNARSKASKALAPLEHVITGVKNISLSDFAAPSPMYAASDRMEMARSAPTQIFASDQDVRTSVQVTFLIAPADTNEDQDQ